MFPDSLIEMFIPKVADQIFCRSRGIDCRQGICALMDSRHCLCTNVTGDCYICVNGTLPKCKPPNVTATKLSDITVHLSASSSAPQPEFHPLIIFIAGVFLSALVFFFVFLILKQFNKKRIVEKVVLLPSVHNNEAFEEESSRLVNNHP